MRQTINSLTLLFLGLVESHKGLVYTYGHCLFTSLRSVVHCKSISLRDLTFT